MKKKSNKQWNPQDFLTRAEKLKLMKIPQSTPERVIVKSNNEALGFKYNCYEECLSSKVDKIKFDSTVKACQKICERIWRMKKSEEGAEYNTNFKYMLMFAVLISFGGFLMLILDIYAGIQDIAFAGIVLLIIAALITVLVVVLSLLTEPRFIDLETEIVGNLREYLAQENSNFYRAKGMEWLVQENFYWLELTLFSKAPEIMISTGPVVEEE